jgi:ribosomal protein S18 acetylase RimI-like enzyme
VTVQLRDVRLPDDRAALVGIDTPYLTDAQYVLVHENTGVRVVRRKLHEPRRQGFEALAADLDDDQRLWDAATVATIGAGTVIGFAATGFDSWNRRLRIWHLYVASDHRRTGVARTLVDAALRRARDLGASHVFVETPGINALGIDFYEHLGFEIVGFDASLYRGTAGEGDVAIYLAIAM